MPAPAPMGYDELSLGLRMLPDELVQRRRAYAAALADDESLPLYLRLAAEFAGEVLDVEVFGVDPTSLRRPA